MTQTNTQATQSTPVNAKVNGAETLEQKIARLEAENLALKAASAGGMGYKCHAKGEVYKDGKGIERVGKGGMSMTGFGAHPVTLYYNQWLRLIEEVKSGRCETAIDGFVKTGKMSTTKEE